jgi:hypothetical protein
MKTRSLLALLTISALCMAAQDVPTFRPKEGTTYTQAFTANLQLAGMSADIKSELATTVKKSTTDAIEISTEYKDFSVDLGDQQMNPPTTPMEVKLGAKMEPLKVSGGVDGTDSVQWFTARNFIPPTGQELKPGMKYTIDLKKTEDIPAMKYDGEYVGTEDMGSTKTHKFKTTFKFEGTDAFNGTQTVWVKGDGTVVKLECEFKNMDVPVANAKADGKASVKLKE